MPKGYCFYDSSVLPRRNLKKTCHSLAFYRCDQILSRSTLGLNDFFLFSVLGVGLCSLGTEHTHSQSRGLNSGCLVYWQTPLPAELSPVQVHHRGQSVITGEGTGQLVFWQLGTRLLFQFNSLLDGAVHIQGESVPTFRLGLLPQLALSGNFLTGTPRSVLHIDSSKQF